MQDIIIAVLTIIIIAGSLITYGILFYKGYQQDKAAGWTLGQYTLAFCYVARQSYMLKVMKYGTLGAVLVTFFSLVIMVSAWYLGFHVLVGYWVLEFVAIMTMKLLPEPNWGFMEKFQVDMNLILEGNK